MEKDTTIKESFLDVMRNGGQPELLDFFNALGEVFFIIDLVDYRKSQVSAAFEKVFGYPESDFYSAPAFLIRIVIPDDRRAMGADYLTLKHGQSVCNECRIVRKDGSTCWVENKFIPTLNANGRLLRLHGVTRDITARKDAEEKHRETEARFRRLVETAQEGIWTIDEYEKTNFVNKKMAEILGYSPHEMIGKELYDFMDDEGKAYAIACMERRRNGAKENLDIRYKTKSGEDLWANIATNPIFDADGVYKGALAMVTDITQRKMDEDALKKSEANLRTIVENTDTAYVLFTTEMVILSFNALAEKYTKQLRGKELMVNHLVQEYFTDERWVFISEKLKQAASGEDVHYELSDTKGDGSLQWVNVGWLNVKDSEGKNWGFILTIKDITEAKTAALEREMIVSDLVQHNNDLEQFTYIVSHNLRAPVANVIALSDMLKENDLDQVTRREVIDRIDTSVKNLDMVIKDLNHILEMRGMSYGKREVVNLQELIETIIANTCNSQISENMQITCHFEEVGSISTVKSYLYSIFYNLLSNSIKYHKDGMIPVISISSRKAENRVELRFKDNGKGIDLSKHSSNIFGLYKRFDNSMEGKGMGLFMVKTQVQALGGTIHIKSQPGEGAEFVIQLPL
jgi:PAS domain S-box-containing protein